MYGLKILLRVVSVQHYIPCGFTLVLFFPLVHTGRKLLKDINVTKTFQATQELHFSNMNTFSKSHSNESYISTNIPTSENGKSHTIFTFDT